MKIPGEIQDRYKAGKLDPERDLFLHSFDEEPGAQVLVVGSCDDDSVHMLCEAGMKVTAVDLKQYDRSPPSNNFEFIRGDFCALPGRLPKSRGMYDVFVSVSAIEHFGLSAYKEGKPHAYYDVLAMRYAWDMLRDNGRAYVSVPFGGRYVELFPHWRVYDRHAALERLVQDFTIEHFNCCISGPLTIGGQERNIGDKITLEETVMYDSLTPHISGMFLLKKVPVTRLSV